MYGRIRNRFSRISRNRRPIRRVYPRMQVRVPRRTFRSSRRRVVRSRRR